MVPVGVDRHWGARHNLTLTPNLRYLRSANMLSTPTKWLSSGPVAQPSAKHIFEKQISNHSLGTGREIFDWVV
jgi:hypothetical protein